MGSDRHNSLINKKSYINVSCFRLLKAQFHAQNEAFKVQAIACQELIVTICLDAFGTLHIGVITRNSCLNSSMAVYAGGIGSLLRGGCRGLSDWPTRSMKWRDGIYQRLTTGFPIALIMQDTNAQQHFGWCASGNRQPLVISRVWYKHSGSHSDSASMTLSGQPVLDVLDTYRNPENCGLYFLSTMIRHTLDRYLLGWI